MSYLIVVAHPDDEVLGAGGTMYKLSRRGIEVNVCILSAKVNARAFRPSDQELQADMDECMALLGVNKKITGDFPNIEFNTVPHLELVRFIEKAIVETCADVIITHHPSDLNNDHVQTSLASQAASRLFQRKENINPLKELLYMEIPSATDWALDCPANAFHANVFHEIGKEGIEKKIKALSMYRGVMREYPHPRSKEALFGLAAYRGGQAKCNYAEAFECAFRRVE